MFARATSGDKRNNNKFSPCSLRSINAVLNTKAKSLKGCFQGEFFNFIFHKTYVYHTHTQPICRHQIVDLD